MGDREWWQNDGDRIDDERQWGGMSIAMQNIETKTAWRLWWARITKCHSGGKEQKQSVPQLN